MPITKSDREPSWEVARSVENVPETSPKWLREQRTALRVIDVRELDELVSELGHIEGVEHVPFGTLNEAAKHWDPAAPLAIVCRSGRRSGTAALLLEGMGFRRVVSLRGGMLAWNQLGFPITRSAPKALSAASAGRALTVVYATDLDSEEEPVLATATSFAIASDAKLVTVHAANGEVAPAQLPHPERLARQWGRAVDCDSLIHSCCEDVTDTLLDALRRLRPDLVICGSHRRRGLSLLVSGSVAEAVARNIDVPTLVVPLNGFGLADASEGKLDVRHIIIPVGDDVSARVGLAAAEWFVEKARLASPELVLLEVGDEPPALRDLPAGRRVRREAAGGSFEAAVQRVAGEQGGTLLVMATRGHDGVGDALLGSHTERVLRGAACPMLIVPVTARLAA